MQEKRIDNIPGMDGDSWVVVKKFTFGEEGLITGNIQLDIGGKGGSGKRTVNFNLADMRNKMLLYGIKDASFYTMRDEQSKLAAIMNLPRDAGNFLFEAVDEFNGAVRDEDLQKKL